MESRVRMILSKSSVKAEVQIVGAVNEILKHNISGIPALMVNGKIVAQKIVPDEAKMKSFILA